MRVDKLFDDHKSQLGYTILHTPNQWLKYELSYFLKINLLKKIKTNLLLV